jgi:phosphoglycerol transferase MdoB-like AlkP superfamily enzyme
VNSFFEWLQTSALGVAVSEVWFPYLESIHVIALALVFGTIVIVDTRLIGWTSRHLRFTYLSERLLPWTWGAFIVAVLTGSALFTSNPEGYAGNGPFVTKMLLLLLAGLNMLYFHKVTYREVAAWDAGEPPRAARLAGMSSLAIWVLIVTLGRWIGFTI